MCLRMCNTICLCSLAHLHHLLFSVRGLFFHLIHILSSLYLDDIHISPTNQKCSNQHLTQDYILHVVVVPLISLTCGPFLLTLV